MGEGSPQPTPTACIVVDEQIVGWIDYDIDGDWLEAGEVNIGYSVFAQHRGQGYGARALELLVRHLKVHTEFATATLLIDPMNGPSLALAAKAGFVRHDEVDGQWLLKRSDL